MVQLDPLTLSALIGLVFFGVLCGILSIAGTIYAVATIWAWQKREVQVVPISQGQTSGLEKIEEMMTNLAENNKAALQDVGFEADELV